MKLLELPQKLNPLSAGKIAGPSSPTGTRRRDLRIAIVGAGFSGICAGLRLRAEGFNQLTIFERAEQVGGVWRDNTYPGAACDIPTPFYSFSFLPNRKWNYRFGRRDEIFAYLNDCVDKTDLRPHIKLSSTVESAVYNEQTCTWTLVVNGESHEFDLFLPACGQLVNPAYPDIPGRDDFAGVSFHSARWDHSVDLTDKKVVVIGTGASAAQFIPEIVHRVAKLTVLQRTPPYLVPRFDTRYGELHHSTFEKVPATQAAERFAWFGVTEFGSLGLVHNRRYATPIKKLALAHLARQVKDPQLRRKLTPDYEVGCKRVIFSNAFYPALARKNVEVVTERAVEITAEGVRTADEVLHEADVIIYGTGFSTSDFVAPMEVTGAGGQTLSEFWKDGAKAHLGISVPACPNMFLLYGPNTNLGSGSIIFMIESQANYIVDAAKRLAQLPSGALEIKRSRFEESDRLTQERLATSVWNTGGCTSWYLHGDRNTNNWPELPSVYRLRTKELDPSEYELREPVAI